jgi:hypothetical protein
VTPGRAVVQTHLNPHTKAADNDTMTRDNNNNALNGVVIGLLSSFGSALLLAFVFLAIYFFRYTSSGRIFLDRIGRPGEYDDEQAFAKEEAEALETMDDMARTEYLRAKGMRRRLLLLFASGHLANVVAW